MSVQPTWPPAGLVHYHDRLAENLLRDRGHDARADIGASPRRVGDHQLHGPAGKIICERDAA